MPRKPQLDLDILTAALHGLQMQRERVQEQIDTVGRMLRSQRAPESAAPAESPRPKRRLSAAGRKAIALAARKRWAEQRKREKEQAQHQKEIHARRVAALQKARKALAAARKAKKAGVRKVAAKKAVAKAVAVKRSAKAAKKAPVKPQTVAAKAPAAAEAVAQ